MNMVGCIRRPEETKIRTVSIHTHSSWEIILNLEGDFCAEIGGESYQLVPGDITVIPPDVPHGGTSKEGYRDIFLQVKKLDFSGVTIVKDTDGAIHDLLHLLHRITVEGGDCGPLVDSFAETICRYIKRYAQSESGHPAVQKLKKTIYEHLYDPDFEIADGMRESGFDKDYLRRCFKKEVGKTPMEYLTSLRMEQAKMLLIQQNFSGVEAVAADCGFADPFYFSTCFKRHTGVSPLQYRKRTLLPQP